MVRSLRYFRDSDAIVVKVNSKCFSVIAVTYDKYFTIVEHEGQL